MRRHFIVFTIMAVLGMCFTACSGPADSTAFTKVKDGRFVRNGEQLSFIGANMWYGAILGSEGPGGNRDRLIKELDELKSLGITNLRVLAGGDGPDGLRGRIEPKLQREAGVYNDTLLVGLDFLLAEMGKRDMQAVLYLTNAWQWSGGYSVYMEWAGDSLATGQQSANQKYGEIGANADNNQPRRRRVSYNDIAAGFYRNADAKQLYYNHVKNMVTRVNSITGKPYTEDPAIFSWQLANEPRAFSRDPETIEAFCGWVSETAALIKSLDKNHMVSTGSEGAMGCNDGDIELAERIHSCPDIDYVNIHIWPYNWRWITRETIKEQLDNAISEAGKYIQNHEGMCERLNKPMVIEEFGFPRDGYVFEPGTPTTSRDSFYKFIFSKVLDSAQGNGHVSGVNFWGWGGFAQPQHVWWERFDDYVCDPGMEEQGLNSVFVKDASTLEVIKETTSKL